MPEFDDFLKPEEAKVRFAIVPTIKINAISNAKHLWLGEPSVHRVLSEINKLVTGDTQDLPTEF